MRRESLDELERLVREYVTKVVKEFTGAGAVAGYTLPAGMSMDPESLSTKPKLRGKWPKPRKKKHLGEVAVYRGLLTRLSQSDIEKLDLLEDLIDPAQWLSRYGTDDGIAFWLGKCERDGFVTPLERKVLLAKIFRPW